MSWHVDRQVVELYENGRVDRVTAASVEVHLTSCDACRSMIGVDDSWLDESWARIADKVEVSPPTLAERALTLVGVRPDLARVMSVTPGLQVSFLLAVALVTGFAVAASRSNPAGDSFQIFLIVAPLLPVVGVALAYGRLVDPTYELMSTSPINSLRLLLLRAAAVITASMLVCLAAWPFVPSPSGLGLTAWLLPALALTLVTLALASRFEVWAAALMSGLGWAVVMLAGLEWEVEVFASSAQMVYLLVAGAAVIAIGVRRNSYDRERGRR